MIPVCEPTLKGNEKKYVADCLDSNWISSNGKYIPLFEQRFSEFCNTKFGVSCCNGTAALHLALSALGIKEGDEVIVPTFTMVASANAVRYTGATPVFVDCEPDTWTIDVTKIEQKITKKTRAIMPVHIYGHPCDMDPIRRIADKYGLYIVEDAAEAHGAEYKAKKAGSLSDVAAFSFYANKIITTGEGGMVVTDDEKIAEKVRLLRNHAFGIPRFRHSMLGYNYRMTNIQAAIGCAQMEYADELMKMRIENAKKYSKKLAAIKAISLPVQKEWAKNVYWMFSILLKKEARIAKDALMDTLYDKGIETRSFFLPMHKQPIYLDNISAKTDYPVSEDIYGRGLYLPSSGSIGEGQIDFIVDSIRNILGK